jgi:hypothetical protein
MPDIDWALVEARRQDQVLAAIERLFKCDRRGVCLLHEWVRRYGTVGGGCHCFARFAEHLTDDELPWDEESPDDD